MSQRLGYNIIGDAPNCNHEAFYQHVARAKPAWVVVINRLDLAKRIAANLPETNVIVRWVTADDDPIRAYGTPENFIAWVRKEFGGARLYANISNEAGFSDTLLKWTCDVIDKAPELNFAVGGFSVGTPEPADWKRPQAVELLRRLVTQHQRLVLNVHEYFPAVPHAGMEGQQYTNPRAMPADIRDIDCWLVGRFQFLVKACQDLGIPVPRIVIGESGADRIDQFKAWIDSLIKTAPYTEIRGWKTLQNQWRLWFNQEPERAYFDYMEYLDKTVYYLPQIEGLCLFAWCSPQSQWEQFDLSQAVKFQQLVEERDNVTVPTLPAAGNYIYKGAATRNIRRTASTTGTVIGALNVGDKVVILPTGDVQVNGYTWLPVLARDVLQGYLAYVAAEMKFEPLPNPEPQEPDFAAVFADIRALASQQRQAALQSVNAQFDALEANITKLESKYLTTGEERLIA